MLEQTVIKIIKFFVGIIVFAILAGCVIILSTRAKAQSISSKCASAVAEIAQENGTLTYSDFETIWKSIKLYEPLNLLGSNSDSADKSSEFRYYTNPVTGQREARHWINIDDIHVYKTEDWQAVQSGSKTLGEITDYVSRSESQDYENVVQRGTALTAVVDVTINIDMPINVSLSNGRYAFGNAEGTITLGVASIPAQTISTKYYKGLDS